MDDHPILIFLCFSCEKISINESTGQGRNGSHRLQFSMGAGWPGSGCIRSAAGGGTQIAMCAAI